MMLVELLLILSGCRWVLGSAAVVVPSLSLDFDMNVFVTV
jgi:hypothetical protein